MMSAEEILKNFWGHDSFRTPQKEIIEAVLAQKDTIALLPTGGGKSVCFQIPALLQDGICLVISPLIALIQDQVKQLKSRGIKAHLIPSGSSQNDIITLFDNLKFGKSKFLYISPERLQSEFIKQKITELNINLIAIDEAHCISEWGHDFRPAYRKISELKILFPTTPFIALTATATQKVLDDISTNLELSTPVIFKKSFFRENLAYQIFTIEDKLSRLLQIFKKTKKPAIIYVNSRKKTEEISNFLNANGFKSSFYHGKLRSENKEFAFKDWMTEKTPIMVATNAFGMGIDKANVGVVIHLSLPNSIENYIQEAGRVGRNGEKAFAVTLYDNDDIRVFESQYLHAIPTIPEIKKVYQKLFQHFQISNGELIETPFDYNFLEFCKKYDFNSHKTAAILQILMNYNTIELQPNFNKKSTIYFKASSKQVLNYQQKNNSFINFIKILLRTYSGIFEQETQIDEFLLAKKAGITSYKVIEFLTILERDLIVTYNKLNADASIRFLLPREDDKTINSVSRNMELFLNQKKEKAKQLVAFIKNDSVCRSVQVLHYFDEKQLKKCGICDVCLSKNKKSVSLEIEILTILEPQKSYTSTEIIEQLLSFNEKDILVTLRFLLSEEKISINKQQKFYIK